MNRLRSALFVVGALLAVSAAQAQEARVRAYIPFDFVVGSRTLPAGEYTVAPEGSANQVISIRSNDRTVLSLSITHACSSYKPSDKTKLVFHSIAGRLFLYQIWAEGETRGRELPKSRSEVELAKNNAPEEFVLAARVTR